MPFTPIHMGPGILIKAVLQTSFSLMVFGWSQIVMDIQPLIAMIVGHGHIHGFTHTYSGAVLVAVFSAVTGKYLSQFGLRILEIKSRNSDNIPWWICFLSAFIGSFSHVFLDSIMHMDVQPFYPFVLENPFKGLVSVIVLHKICLYSGLIGTVLFYLIHVLRKDRKS
jgi:membrane-bound metal-dependent hydrolase YbcI (DUF457 family)